MKNTRKLFMLGLMLLGVAGVNHKESPAEVKAYESGSYATLKSGQLNINNYKRSIFAKITITNDKTKLRENETVWGPYEVGNESSSMTDGCNVAAYVYKNEEDSTMYDCVIYADVATIYAGKYSSNTFKDFSNVKEIIFDNFNTSKAIEMNSMFSGCENLIALDVSKFNTSNVTKMNYMFQNCSSLTELDLSKFNTSKVTTMFGMFWGCENITKLDLSKFNTTSCTNMNSMFYYCSSLTEVNLSSFNTSEVTGMSAMFNGCSSLTELDISHFDTSKVTNMTMMFNGCSSLTELDVSNFDTSKVTAMGQMFRDCENLTELDLSNFNTSRVTRTDNMFSGCSSLTELDLSSFDMGKVTNTSNMLSGMDNLQQIEAPKNLGNTAIDLPETFTLLDPVTGEKITKLDNSMVNKEITQSSSKLAEIVTAINSLNTCDDYAQAPSLRAQYEALDDADKEAFGKFKNNDDVLLMDKLEYMEYMLSIKGTNTSDNQMLKTLESNDYNIITIAVLTLTSFIGIAGYYFIQKRKSIKA